MSEMNHILVPEEDAIAPTQDAANVDEPTVVENEPRFVTGIVVGCRNLNVREQMNLKAAVLCVLPVSAEVQVYADEYHDKWYHVFTEDGFDGFCMKKYISVNQ